MTPLLTPESTRLTPTPSVPPATPDQARLDSACLPESPLKSVLNALRQWSEAGTLRALDGALARFMLDLHPGGASPVLLLSTALLAHLEGQGHSCLPLAALLQEPALWLDWPTAALQDFNTLRAGLPALARDWITELQQSPLVWAADAPAAADVSQPLVLHAGKLYLRRYWCYEQQVATQVLARVAGNAVAQEAGFAPAQVRHWLGVLFAPAAPTSMAAAAPSHATQPARLPAKPTDQDPSGAAAVDWQQVACALALRGRLTIITGGPGTGKTYTVARLLALLLALDPQAQRRRVALAAPTGKAAARLKQSIDSALDGLQQRLGDALPLRDWAARIGAAHTLHALLGASPDTRQLRYHAGHLLDVDVLIVDEASMVHLEMMAALLAALPTHARLILLGDKDQLASVEAGAVLGDLCRNAESGYYHPATAAYIEAATGQRLPPDCLAPTDGAGSALAQQTVMLRQSRRFAGPIGQLALAVNQGQVARASALLATAVLAAGTTTGPAGATASNRSPAVANAPSSVCRLSTSVPAEVVALALHGRVGAPGGYADYASLVRQGPASRTDADHAAWVRAVLTAFDRFRVLCAVRDGDWGVTGLNTAIESALVAQRWLVKHGTWYEGRPVMVTRNDHSLGVFNGDIGIALRAPAAAGLRVHVANGPALRSFGVRRLAQVETAFALTVHKSQGSEFAHTVLVLPPQAQRGLTRELIYTGITRSSQALTLVSASVSAWSDALRQPTQRASGLAERLNGGAAIPGTGNKYPS